MNITPQSLNITQLLSAESEQYVVPPYQRRYSWHEKQLCELLDDVDLLEGADSGEFEQHLSSKWWQDERQCYRASVELKARRVCAITIA